MDGVGCLEAVARPRAVARSIIGALISARIRRFDEKKAS
jgi:hypothetical protein